MLPQGACCPSVARLRMTEAALRVEVVEPHAFRVMFADLYVAFSVPACPEGGEPGPGGPGGSELTEWSV